MLAQHKYYETLSRKFQWHVEPNKIIENSVSYKKWLSELCYVYFLLDGNEIVYVGLSDTLQNRFHAHTKDKKFDRVSWIQVKRHDQKYIEAYYIVTLKPKYNKFVPVRVRSNPPEIRIKEMSNITKIGTK